MIRLLVPDAETRKAFDVISILTGAFPDSPVIVGDVEGTRRTTRHLYRLFKSDVEILRVSNVCDFVSDLIDISEKYVEDRIVFIPLEEHSVAFFYYFLKRYGKKNFAFLLPDEKVFYTLRDKGSLNEYCCNNRLSAPAYYRVEELSNLEQDKFPILLKPCVGSGSEGQIRLYKPQDFSKEILSEISKKPYMAQEFLGNGHDVHGAFYLYDEDGFVDAYTHERIRTSPPTGGVTVLSKLSHNQTVIDEGRKILDLIGWKGLIMLEFLYDEKSGKYKVIEANPRVWGSIMLSEFGGSHLLTNYVRRCIGEQSIADYRDGDSYIRWLFPVDVLNYIRSLGHIKAFWNFRNTCYINWSYARHGSAIRFNLWNIFKIKNLKRYMRK